MTNHKHRQHKTDRPVGQTPAVVFTDEPAAGEWPPPVVFLNYPGYHLGQLGQIRGPMLQHDRNDQLLTVVSESYDTVTHTTRHGLTYGIVSKRVAA